MADKVIKAAHKMPYVTGINQGRIDPKAKSKQPRLKFSVINGGLEVKVLAPGSMQVLRLSTTCPLRVEKELSKLF
jgi:hypothetical protein